MEKQLLTKLKISQLSVELEPLTKEHAEAFCEQYRDPSIGKLTNLPSCCNALFACWSFCFSRSFFTARLARLFTA